MGEAISVAICGTRGIPNNYGGFEQFAQHLAVELVARGYEVIVYNPHFHAVSDDLYHGVKIVSKWCPESLLGPFAHYVYDYLCLRDAMRRRSRIVLECGCTSSGPGLLLLRQRGAIVVLNTDGIEWTRAKWGRLAKALIRLSEKTAIRRAAYLVADNPGIATYLRKEYDEDATVIPYGTTVPESVDVTLLDSYGLRPNGYFLAVARLEPENNIEAILQGFLASGSAKSLCIVGNHHTRYGRYLRTTFGDERIKYLGGIYRQPVLHALRHFSALYFHGHSVGGTNPSLLDAMADGALICAHDNVFNRAVLGDDGLYFSTREEVAESIRREEENLKLRPRLVENNLAKVRSRYSWQTISDAYEALFLRVSAERSARQGTFRRRA
ncbi:MAG TPA: DUF1972 domain-containing protein [Gammaproteobacteria bacterium]|nr:DUF1972 domain-containing protein [Gammaproteobacteria bacterium]